MSNCVEDNNPMFLYIFFLIELLLNLHFQFTFLFFGSLKILYEHYFLNNMYMSMENVLCFKMRLDEKLRLFLIVPMSFYYNVQSSKKNSILFM